MFVLWPFVSFFLSWLFREVVIRFVIFSAFVMLVAFFMPLVMSHLAPFLGVDLAGLMGSFSPAMWYFLDPFRLDVGLPLVLSAWVSRFLIRRIPLVG